MTIEQVIEKDFKPRLKKLGESESEVNDILNDWKNRPSEGGDDLIEFHIRIRNINSTRMREVVRLVTYTSPMETFSPLSNDVKDYETLLEVCRSIVSSSLELGAYSQTYIDLAPSESIGNSELEKFIGVYLSILLSLRCSLSSIEVRNGSLTRLSRLIFDEIVKDLLKFLGPNGKIESIDYARELNVLPFGFMSTWKVRISHLSDNPEYTTDSQIHIYPMKRSKEILQSRAIFWVRHLNPSTSIVSDVDLLISLRNFLNFHEIKYRKSRFKRDDLFNIISNALVSVKNTTIFASERHQKWHFLYRECILDLSKRLGIYSEFALDQAKELSTQIIKMLGR